MSSCSFRGRDFCVSHGSKSRSPLSCQRGYAAHPARTAPRVTRADLICELSRPLGDSCLRSSKWGLDEAASRPHRSSWKRRASATLSEPHSPPMTSPTLEQADLQTRHGEPYPPLHRSVNTLGTNPSSTAKPDMLEQQHLNSPNPYQTDLLRLPAAPLCPQLDGR